MKSYTITVNGNVYDVTVEENEGGVANTAKTAPKAAPKAAPKPAAKPAGGAGSIKVEAGAAGKVVAIDANVGDAMNAGDTIVVLEIMKMETPVVAPKAGTVASIEVSVGQSVESGAVLATMNE